MKQALSGPALSTAKTIPFFSSISQGKEYFARPCRDRADVHVCCGDDDVRETFFFPRSGSFCHTDLSSSPCLIFARLEYKVQDFFCLRLKG